MHRQQVQPFLTVINVIPYILLTYGHLISTIQTLLYNNVILFIPSHTFCQHILPPYLIPTSPIVLVVFQANKKEESEKLLSKNSPILKTTLCLYTISTPEGKREGTQIEQATCTAKLSTNQIGHFRAD